MTARRSYQVTGMSCEHCVNAVRGEVSRIPGVTHVDVDLDTGRVTVTSEQPLDDAASPPQSTRPATRSHPD